MEKLKGAYFGAQCLQLFLTKDKKKNPELLKWIVMQKAYRKAAFRKT
jgi:hypothetical protein